MAPDVNNLIDFSSKNVDSKTESKTLYNGKINEESLKKLGDTLKLDENEIVAVRAKLLTLIETIKTQFLNPHSPKTQKIIDGKNIIIENPTTANLKKIEDRYDNLMSDLRNLNTVAARQISELLGLDANSIGNELNDSIIAARKKEEKRNSTKDYGVKQKESESKPVVTTAVEGKNTNTTTASLNNQNPYEKGGTMWIRWETLHAGK